MDSAAAQRRFCIEKTLSLRPQPSATMFFYYLFRFFAFVVQCLPAWCLYRLSDAMAWLLYRGVGYRRKVVYDNLRRAFPAATDAEIQNIAAASYRNMTDVLLETIQSFGMTDQQILARYTLENLELPNQYAQAGRSVLVTAAHYANWEWGVKVLPSVLRHTCIATYRPLQQAQIEQYLHRSRTAYGMRLFATRETHRAFIEYADQCYALFMMPDGSPAKPESAHRILFLGRETACIHGPAKYSQAHDLPVLYLAIQRVARGKYSGKFMLLAEQAQQIEPTEITRRIMQALSDQIALEPADWLWTHRRWKH